MSDQETPDVDVGLGQAVDDEGNRLGTIRGVDEDRFDVTTAAGIED